MCHIAYINYNQSYLESVVDCWNQALTYDPISIDRFEQIVLYDENFDEELLVLAVEEDKVVGFILGVKRKVSYLTKGLEPERGWISIMGVHPDYQRKGIGQELYYLVEGRLIERGVKEITLCAYSPNYFTPGIDVRYPQGINFFRKNQYEMGGDAVSMQRDLWDFVMPEYSVKKTASLAEEGIRIINYSKQYLSKLFTFLEEEFDAGWKRNVLLALQKDEAENTIILCVDQNDDVIGYCMRKIDGNDARFGPIGVKESLRSKGLGGVLFDRMMLGMKKHGTNYAYFLWTHGDAIRFYERHGMKIYRSYELYRKKVKDE